jgi:hypothetical protein
MSLVPPGRAARPGDEASLCWSLLIVSLTVFG